ncbi:DUF6056 family protein [Hymenobacter sediminicola]|uniref:Glycosyltransferase family 39 protein n=1 Tax=Hymenobacter sediminicola TaxID=2761579 RepID=A0A7G7W7A9_9BACT|nr:DUF6056 family protein [Hymenobacter sediminicola]QNH62252.1 hypothetical protein H4317_19290 [Hymenobacter sediminicola]
MPSLTPETIRRTFWRSGPWLLAAALILALLPFFALAWYSHPSSDDFLLANGLRDHGLLGYQRYMYLNWTGRYSSVLLWSLFNPVAYGGWELTYRLLPLFFLLAALVTFYSMLRGLLRSFVSVRALWLSSATLLLLLLFQLPSTAEGIYWVTGMYNYLLPALFALLLLVILARYASTLEQAAKRRWLLAAVLVTVFVIGANEVLALPLLVALSCFTILRAWQQKRLPLGYSLLTIVAAVACAVSFLAPGNYIRMASEPQHFGVAKAAVLAAAAAGYCVINWLGNGVLLAVTLLLAPLSAKLAQQPELPLNQLTRNPLLITALLFGLLIVGFFPSFWATGMPIPLRARNMLYLFFLVGWFLQAHAWIRYLLHQGWWPQQPLPAYVSVLLGAWLLLAFVTDHNLRLRGPEQLANSNNSVLAYRDWLGGSAARYDAQLTARYRQLQAAPVNTICTVSALQEPPLSLSFLDLSAENPQDWTNQEYAKFFRKKEIRAVMQP